MSIEDKLYGENHVGCLLKMIYMVKTKWDVVIYSFWYLEDDVQVMCLFLALDTQTLFPD